MGIKQQIASMLNSNSDFALVDAGEDDVCDYKQKSLNFLNAKTYGEASGKAEELIKFTLDIHAKTQAMGPIIKSMRDFELKGNYDYKQQRIHYLHSANNLLLGFYLYHGCSLIKKAIEDEMKRTSEKKTIRYDGDICDWQYSGGSIEGEFFYRWRLCSLCHDIGYPISLSNNDTTINEYLSKFGINSISTLKNTILHGNKQLLEDVLDLKTYIEKKESHPGPGKEKYDHGIMGGLIFLYKIKKLFDGKPLIERTKIGKKIIWDGVVYNTSLKEVASAVAMHNLEMNEVALCGSLLNPKNYAIYDINKKSLAWLLKVTDILQEWDKPIAQKYDENEPIPENLIEIETAPEMIIIKSFDFDTKDKICKKIKKYFKQKDILKFS